MTNEAPPWLRSEPGAVTLEVLVQPRASRDRIVGTHEGRLKIQLSAPPVDGAANAALVAFLAALLGLPRRDVVLLRGETGRRKSVRLEGAEAGRVVAAVVGSTPRKA